MPPKLSELKRAHTDLLSEYLSVIDDVSYLPFFIDIRGDRMAFQEVRGVRKVRWVINKIASTLSSLSNPRPLIRLIAETHIRGKLRELCRVYRQRSIVLKSKGAHGQIQTWMDRAINEAREMEDTLQSWKTFWDAVSSLVGVLSTVAVVLFGLNSVSDFIPQVVAFFTNVTEENMLQVMYTLFPLIMIVMVFWSALFGSFSIKRALFIARGKGHKNVYEKEDELFSLLGRGKNKEYPLDLASTLVLVLIMGLGFTVWMHRLAIRLEAEADSFLFVFLYATFGLVLAAFIYLWIARKPR